MKIRPLNAREKRTWPKEVIVKLEKAFVDIRGSIQPLVDLPMESAVLIHSKKGAVRANHYHQTDWHFCYVLSGSIEYLHRPTGSRAQAEERVRQGRRAVLHAADGRPPDALPRESLVPRRSAATRGRRKSTRRTWSASRRCASRRPRLENAYYHRSTCRLCAGSGLTKVLALTPTPPANAFVTEAELAAPQPAYPLDVWLCNGCGHVQLLDVVDPRILYAHYVYVSGTSPVFVRHFEQYAQYVGSQFKPAAGSLALDIGSNDGTLLRFFKQAGHRVLGIEPAEEISEASRQAGIPTLTGFFSEQLAQRIVAEHGRASVVTANNVAAHIDDLAGVMRGVAKLLAPDGVFVFEVSYLVDVFEKTLFDTIYHEHLDYHTVEPLVPFFASCGLQLIEAQRVDSHGGSLRGVAQLAGGPRKVRRLGGRPRRPRAGAEAARCGLPSKPSARASQRWAASSPACSASSSAKASASRGSGRRRKRPPSSTTSASRPSWSTSSSTTARSSRAAIPPACTSRWCRRRRFTTARSTTR